MDKELSKLFSFPIIMIDGDNEERKESRNRTLGLDNDDDESIDVIIGEAECPYYDFVSVSDRWLPTRESLDKAIKGKFEACNVVFGQAGSFMVPWPRKKFKRELARFISELPAAQEISFSISKDDVEKILKGDMTIDDAARQSNNND